MKKEIKIPLDQNGIMLRYDDFYTKSYVDNFEWKDELRYVKYGRGRSAAYFEFLSLTSGKPYYMFMTDFDEIVDQLRNGVLKGEFTFVKRGSNYGIKKVIKEKLKEGGD